MAGEHVTCGGERFAYFAIFDGHGGKDAADRCQPLAIESPPAEAAAIIDKSDGRLETKGSEGHLDELATRTLEAEERTAASDAADTRRNRQVRTSESASLSGAS